MSKYYADNGEYFFPEYGPGRTKQSFKDQCDINKILKKAQIKGGLAHVQKYPEASYGEFDQNADLFTARERIEKATKIFNELPAEVRREFDNDPLAFTAYAAKQPPGELIQKIPAIAEPGNYFPNPVQRADAPSEAPQAANAPDPIPEPTLPTDEA